MNKKDKIKLKRKSVAILFGNKCNVCLKKFGKNFHFHHIRYRVNEKIYSDFNTWEQYNEYVLPIIEKLPQKFALLCKKCHRLISILQCIKDDMRFERVVDLSRRSRR